LIRFYEGLVFSDGQQDGFALLTILADRVVITGRNSIEREVCGRD